MANNIDIKDATGTTKTTATEDISGVHYQKTKLFDATAASTNGLTIDANGDLHALIGSRVVVSTDEMTRPSDTTAYTANDAVADSTSAPTYRTFASAARVSAGSGYVIGALLLIDNTAAAWNNAAIRLWLYSNNTGSKVNDNAAFNGPLYADKAILVGYIDFPGFLVESGTPTAQHATVQDLRIPFVCNATTLYGLYEIKNAPTTVASAQKFYCALTIEQN